MQLFDRISIQVVIYLSIISVLYTLVLTWFLYRSKITENKRVEAIENRKNMEATINRVGDELQQHNKEVAIDRVETRFSNIRRLVVPTLTLFYLLLFTLPLINYIPATYISILVGGITVSLGIAAKPFIENVIAGVLMSYGKSIRVGDTVEIDGHYSTIEDISITYTVIKVWDWKRYVIPNSVLLQKEFLNYSLNDRDIWAYVEFFVAPDSNLDIVEEVAKTAMKESRYLNPVEEPKFWIISIGETSLKCWVAGWAKNPSEAWELRSESRKTIMARLAKHRVASNLNQVRLDRSNDDT